VLADLLLGCRLLTVQVLYGLQQRTRSGAHTRVSMLRLVVEDLRRAQADSVHAAVEAPPPGMGREKRTVLAALAGHAALAVSNPETEKTKTCGNWRCSGYEDG
jgi:hypothetical protein